MLRNHGTSEHVLKFITHKISKNIQFVFVLIPSVAELVTKLYEAAVRKVPASEEYHSHLFMAYARVGEYKKMQQVLIVSALIFIFYTIY